MTPELPSVTAVCLTRNRREWLPKAIAQFQTQTYLNRRLLIVADGDDVSDLIPGDLIPGDPPVWLYTVLPAREPAVRKIGPKRNFANSLVTTDLIAHWDDDDYSAPERLADQVRRLVETGMSVTGYHTMKFTDGARWWQYEGFPAFAFGTSLMYRRAWWERNRFPDLHVCEDSIFVRAAVRARQFIAPGDLDLMYATIHPGNTSPRRIGGNWRELPDYRWGKAA